MDTSLVGHMTGRLMDQLDEAHDSEEAKLRTVLIVCEIDYPTGTHLHMSCSDDRPWAQQAFAQEVADIICRRRDQLESAAQDEEDED